MEVALHRVPGVGDALVLLALLVVVEPLVHLVGHDGVDLAAEHVHRDCGADLKGKTEVVMKETDPACGETEWLRFDQRLGKQDTFCARITNICVHSRACTSRS